MGHFFLDTQYKEILTRNEQRERERDLQWKYYWQGNLYVCFIKISDPLWNGPDPDHDLCTKKHLLNLSWMINKIHKNRMFSFLYISFLIIKKNHVINYSYIIMVKNFEEILDQDSNKMPGSGSQTWCSCI